MPQVAVVIGRFQVPNLTIAHYNLLTTAAASAERLMILVGDSPAMPCRRNPLPAFDRICMLQQAFPQADVYRLLNCRTNLQWSTQIDELIGDRSVVFWGGRDSSLDAYCGKHQMKAMYSGETVSGTEARDAVVSISTAAFRAGMIHAQNIVFPRTYPVVDIIIRQGDKLLVGRRPTESQWRFPGGFVDPLDTNLEQAAIRELMEETGVIAPNLTYLGSWRVQDWRYRGSTDGIMTTAFIGSVNPSVVPVAGDDLVDAEFRYMDELASTLVSEHLPLYERAVYEFRR